MNRRCLQIGLSVAMLTLAAGGIAGVTLTTASFQDSLRPILPGWGRHFWNQKSVVYQHPPAFDFTNVANAVAYRFDILDDRHDLISFTAAKPTESLASVWTNVAARGFVTVFCHGVDASGRDCGAAGEKRTFWKNPPFDPAKCEPGTCPYAEAALKQYEFVFSMPHVRKMVETGKLDYTYEHNCYPTKMNVCLIGSALHYGEPVNPNRLMPFNVCDFLLALAETTGEAKYRAAADRAFAYVERGPLANWNWEGQFEDVQPSEPYQNLTKHPACDAALYLLRRYPGDQARLAQARALLDFCEDQFVFWERPCRADGATVHHPRLKDLAPKWPILPVALEQYRWYVPVNASLAKMIRTYLALYRAEKNPLDLAKAKALGDACTRAQCQPGCIPSEWMGEIDKTIAHTTWINCQIATAEALEELAKCCATMSP